MSANDDDRDIIEDVIEEQEAVRIGRWRQVQVTITRDSPSEAVIVQWQDEDDEIAVFVTRREGDDEDRYSARATAIAEDVPFGNKTIAFSADSLETALDDAISWMRRHRPGIPFPTFSAQIEGGVFKPLIEVIDRLGGGKMLVEVRDTGLHIESASHVNAIEFDITASDMESYEVEVTGEFSVKSDSVWNALKSVRFSDPVPLSIDGSEERPRFGVAGTGTFAKVATDYNRRTIPEPFPFDARFVIPGLEFRDKVNAARLIESDTGVFGLRDGVVFLRIEDAGTGEELTARIEASETEGEQVVLINPSRLQQLRRAIPRPSQTAVTFTIKGDDPMLVEYRVDGTEVDVTIALKTGPVPREVDIPPAEIQVPEGKQAPPPEEEAVEDVLTEDVTEDDDVLGQVAAEAAAEAAGQREDETPEPPEEEEPEERRVNILVRTLGGTLNYLTEEPVPDRILTEVIEASRDVLGPPGQFEQNDTVGAVSFRGAEIQAFNFNPGRRLLGGAKEGSPADDERETAREPEPPSEPESEPEPTQFSRGEVATIVEGATAGVDVAAQIIGSQLNEIKLRPKDGAPVRFTTDAETLTVASSNGAVETILEAIERWEMFVAPDSISDDLEANLNERREALAEQFGIAIPPVGAFMDEDAAPGGVSLDGFTEDEVREIIERATAGVLVRIRANPGANSLRVQLDPDPASSVEFDDRLREIQGTLDHPVDVINEVLAEWEQVVDLGTIPRLEVTRQREQLEADFGVDLLELGDEPPEASEEMGESPQIEVEGVWAKVKEIALDQRVPTEDRRNRIGEVLEPKLLEDYPTLFDELVVEFVFENNQGGGQSLEESMTLELGGMLSSEGKRQLASPGTLRILTGSGGVADPEAIWTKFEELVAIFNPDEPRFGDITDFLTEIANASAFRIEEGLVDWDRIILPPEMIREIIRRSSDAYLVTILGHMEDESNAWYAAQRVNECAQGIENVCDLIEREISGTNRRGYTEWYLEHAYRIFLENGAFDTEAFIRDFHDVFRPGETEAEARSRRGEVDLSVLGRPGRRPEPDEEEVEPEPKPEATPEPEPEPEPEPAPEPGPEPETPEPEGELQTVAILVGRDQGNLVYMATDDVPQAVQSGVEVAANEVLGPAGNFDQNDQVGTVTVRGTDVVDIDLSEGRRILELMRIEGVGEVSEERAIEDFRQEIRERLD